MADTKQTRIGRESRTVAAMIALYCREQHGRGGLCPECGELLDYARERLKKCPFQEGKTTCAKCPVHCYRPAMRERIRAVMRYSGPRMMYRHPLLAARHLIDGRRKKPARRSSQQSLSLPALILLSFPAQAGNPCFRQCIPACAGIQFPLMPSDFGIV